MAHCTWLIGRFYRWREVASGAQFKAEQKIGLAPLRSQARKHLRLKTKVCRSRHGHARSEHRKALSRHHLNPHEFPYPPQLLALFPPVFIICFEVDFQATYMRIPVCEAVSAAGCRQAECLGYPVEFSTLMLYSISIYLLYVSVMIVG